MAFPSGDPVADRRASYAEALALEGDFAAAAEVMAGALELAPGWAAGWYRLGEWREQADFGDAAAAWQQAVEADPTDRLGARLRWALAQGVRTVESMPSPFVELLFDQYAPAFDAALVERLNYRGPQLLKESLLRAGFTRAERALDLGCGTGLMGEALRGHAGWLEGWDISSGMLAEARGKGVYDALDKRDITELSLGAERYDLIVAADVFLYIGALERVVAWCAGSLKPGGRLAFTVERGTQAVELRESRRFAHSADYVRGLLSDAGFGAVRLEDCVVRRDRGADVAAFCVVAEASRVARDLEGDGDTMALA
ncbi:MAG: methyltransferase domain-containing protein [Pseudooceanicola sp.]|nr:methyltransferase domain-containing protein [Pseudooceanicola sp.]